MRCKFTGREEVMRTTARRHVEICFVIAFFLKNVYTILIQNSFLVQVGLEPKTFK